MEIHGIGALLLKIREEKGVSQKELALGLCTQRELSKIEADEKENERFSHNRCAISCHDNGKICFGGLCGSGSKPNHTSFVVYKPSFGSKRKPSLVSSIIISSKYKLNQQHIAYGTRADTEQGIALPQVKQRHHSAANGLGNAKGSSCQGNILQTVDNQHTHDGIGQNLAKVGDQRRCGAVFSEDQEGQEPQRHGDQRSHGNDEGGVEVIHGRTSCAAKSELLQ